MLQEYIVKMTLSYISINKPIKIFENGLSLYEISNKVNQLQDRQMAGLKIIRNPYMI